MFKTGVCSVKDILLKDKTIFRKELKNVSITLYDQIVGCSNASELAERILLLFTDDRGAYKRTYAGRFEDFDSTVLDCVKTNFDNDKSLIVHDVGVSDGRTALDFFKKISGSFDNLQYIASDYDSKVYVLKSGKCKLTLNNMGKVLEILFSPFVFNALKRDSYRHYPINHLIRKILDFFVVPSILKKYKQGILKAKEIVLFASEVLKEAGNNSKLTLAQHNLLEPFQEKYSVIRAMNVLNNSYFSNQELHTILKHIHNGLLEGGVFIVGSNQESGTVVHGGIYKKTDKGFLKIAESGNGAAIHEILVSL
jgi:hypothetical protein